MKLLLINSGSSSLKGTLVESTDGTTLARGLADWAGTVTRYQYTFFGVDDQRGSEEVLWKGHAQAVTRFLHDLAQSEPAILTTLVGVGHRVVHGGPFTSSVLITPEVRSRITELVELAPLHNPPSLAALAAAEAALPGVPQVAVFDTAFHATLPPEAFTYPVPANWTRDWGIRRYGFHGLSFAYCTGRAAEMLKRPTDQLKLVICHLGHGCSAAAVRGGESIETTMGFTPLEGLMMATRSGSIDPSVVLHLQHRHGMTPDQIESALNSKSGLLGVSEVSADMRQVSAAARAGNESARLAIAIYAHRVRQAIGALTVTLEGIDALVFTAGVGEHSAEIRASVCTGLQCLGLELDLQANNGSKPDADIASSQSRGRILIIETREDTTMLREVTRVLAAEKQ